LSSFVSGVFFSSILLSLWQSFYYTYLFIEKSRNQEITNLQHEASRNEIELKNLREQINPHFLFNSLNSIKALVEIDKDEAKSAITKLSNLLRKSLHLSKKQLILISEELEIVNTYIDLEKIRFEERIQSELIIDENALTCKIPPLMIQTLVENAIKHGLSKSITGGVLRLSISKDKEIIDIKIKNTGKLEPDIEITGIGIQNTIKRLDILFGEEGKFKIYQDDDLVCVEIQIVCKD
jgi:LytS/YehU family sensor histidine kinase